MIKKYISIIIIIIISIICVSTSNSALSRLNQLWGFSLSKQDMIEQFIVQDGLHATDPKVDVYILHSNTPGIDVRQINQNISIIELSRPDDIQKIVEKIKQLPIAKEVDVDKLFQDHSVKLLTYQETKENKETKRNYLIITEKGDKKVLLWIQGCHISRESCQI